MNASQTTSKYSPLTHYLTNQSNAVDSIDLSFPELESILGFPLPQSAMKHRPWWANVNPIYASQARGWLDAGFQVATVDLLERKVRFARVKGLELDLDEGRSNKSGSDATILVLRVVVLDAQFLDLPCNRISPHP